MKQLTLIIPEDLHAQLVAAATPAGQTAEQLAVTALRLGLPLVTAAPVSPPSLSTALATLQANGASDQYLDW
jgi:hypothetical protein